jgi:hypothetical protein
MNLPETIITSDGPSIDGAGPQLLTELLAILEEGLRMIQIYPIEVEVGSHPPTWFKIAGDSNGVAVSCEKDPPQPALVRAMIHDEGGLDFGRTVVRLSPYAPRSLGGSKPSREVSTPGM